MDFKSLYIKGMLELQKQKEAKDTEGEKRYRGGNAGIMHNGIPANSCARKMIARSEDRFEETSWNTQLMFDMGELNEVRWHDKLRAAGIICHSADDMVKTATKGGTPITGSPDTIIVEDGDERFLIEHKHISSFWTFRDKVIEGNPSTEHIAQAGFYSMNIDKTMPFCVLYTSSVKFSGPSFLTNLVPKANEPGSEHFEYTYYYYTGEMKTYKGKKSKVKKKLPVPGHLQGLYPKDLFITLGADFAEFKNTIPTIVQYDLKWIDGVIHYSKQGSGVWTQSIVTAQNIMDFYNYAEECEKDEVLPKRPATLDATGKAKGFNSCDYCSLSEVCDKYENGNYKVWLEEAKKVRW